jgi:UDP-glucose 4-epimerase
MKKHLITGGAGFIGSTLAKSLIAKGEDVTVLDNLETGNLENLEGVLGHERFHFVKGDICDARLVDELTSKADVVEHLAARIGLQIIIGFAHKTLETNVKGTEIVLEAAAKYGRRTILASTSEVYGLTERIPSAETDPIIFGAPMKSRWSYACGKALDEFWALALHRERNLPVTVVRLFNTVGPRQSARYGMVVPRLVRQALANEPLTVYGDGTQTRCFCYVGDVVDALQNILADDRTIGELYNLGNPQECTIVGLAQRIVSLTKSQSKITYVPYTQAYGDGFEEIMRRVPDISKLQSAIGFKPKTSLDDILRSVIGSVQELQIVA